MVFKFNENDLKYVSLKFLKHNGNNMQTAQLNDANIMSIGPEAKI